LAEITFGSKSYKIVQLYTISCLQPACEIVLSVIVDIEYKNFSLSLIQRKRQYSVFDAYLEGGFKLLHTS
jgi:hypothetical protein